MTVAAAPAAPAAPTTEPVTPPATAPVTPPATPPAVPPVATAPPVTAPVPPVTPPAAVVPETYTWTVPDPDRAYMPEADLTQYAQKAKQYGLSQEEANVYVAEEIAARRDTETRLMNELKADPEVGGDKLAATQQAADAFVDKWLPKTDPRRAAWDTRVKAMGYANFAPLVVMMARAGASLLEDRPPIGQQPTADPNLPGYEKLWPGGGKAAQQKQPKG